MVASLALLAKRALVSLLLALARQYNVSAMVKRDSSDQDVEKAFRRVVKKVHPDKGGEVAHAQRLQDAREKWLLAKKKAQSGRPRKYDRQPTSSKSNASQPTGILPVLGKQAPRSRAYMIRSPAVLLTWHFSQTSRQPPVLTASALQSVSVLFLHLQLQALLLATS